MLNLLKDKAKEIKALEKKLAKVEKKYVEVYKEHKDLVNDKQTFDGFLKHVFKERAEEEILTG